MDHTDHVRLLSKAIPQDSGGVWADLGSGEGAFTLALADLIGEEGKIYSVDKDKLKIVTQSLIFETKFPNHEVHFLNVDMTQNLSLPLLDGIVMANVLHFFKNPEIVLKKLRVYLKKDGKLIIIEYNSDQANIWVPYPIPFNKLEDILKKAGFTKAEKLDAEPSDFMNEIYSSISFRV